MDFELGDRVRVQNIGPIEMLGTIASIHPREGELLPQFGRIVKPYGVWLDNWQFVYCYPSRIIADDAEGCWIAGHVRETKNKLDEGLGN